MTRSLSPFSPTRRGHAKTALGANVAEDSAARKVIRFVYADVLDVFATAEEYPEDQAFTADWLATFAADACEIPLAEADALVGRILAAPAMRKLRGKAVTRARFALREMLAGPGIVSLGGSRVARRVWAVLSDRRARDILAERPAPRRSSLTDGAWVVASGTHEDGARWKATLYRPRGGRVLSVASVRLGRYMFAGDDLGPADRLPDGRTAREAVRAWSRDRARTEGERKLAARFLQRRLPKGARA